MNRVANAIYVVVIVVNAAAFVVTQGPLNALAIGFAAGLLYANGIRWWVER